MLHPVFLYGAYKRILLARYGDGTFVFDDAMRRGDMDIIIVRVLDQLISCEYAVKKIGEAFSIASVSRVVRSYSNDFKI